MVEVKQLVDNSGEFYPVTAAEAVIFANGENLEEKEFGTGVTIINGIWNTSTCTTTISLSNLEAAAEKIKLGEPVTIRLVEDAEDEDGYFSIGIFSKEILLGSGLEAFFPSLYLSSTVAASHGLSADGYYPVVLGFSSYDGSSSIKRLLLSTSDVSGKENVSNKVTAISSSSTDTQYPSAKCMYDIVGDIELALNIIINGTS